MLTILTITKIIGLATGGLIPGVQKKVVNIIINIKQKVSAA